jgi:hypothetical protein
MNVDAAIVGLESFCRYLNATGRSARIVGSANGLPVGVFSRDKNIIALEGSEIDLVTLRMAGIIGPRQSLGARSFGVSIGVLPLAGNQLIPIQHHWIVRLSKPAYPWLATKLVQRTQGFFKKRRVGLAWTGQLVGPLFEAEPDIIHPLREHFQIHDTLEIVPEPDAQLVRIIHKHATSVSYNLFAQNPVSVQRNHAGARLIAAFEKMAEILKRV